MVYRFKVFWFSLFIALSCLSAGCVSKMIEAAIPQSGYEKTEVLKVKSVAIVAFDVLQFQPTGLAGKVAGSTLATAQHAANLQTKSDPLALELYEKWVQQLKAEKKFKVLPAQDVLKNQVYQRLFKSKKEGIAKLQNASPSHRPLTINGLLRPINPTYLLTPAERAELLKALKVDALLISRVSYYTKQNDLLGLGVAKIYLEPIVAFHLYSASSEDPIWFANAFDGTPSADSIGSVSGMEDVGNIQALNLPLGEQAIAAFLRSR